MPKTSKTRLFFQQLQLRLSRLSFRTGLWVLAGCALSYLLAFAPILLPLSLSTKGVLWFIFFGLAKTLQYTALAIIGKEGIQRIRLWWRERKTKLSQKKWEEARKSLGVFQDYVGDFTTNLRLFCNPLGEVPHTSPYYFVTSTFPTFSSSFSHTFYSFLTRAHTAVLHFLLSQPSQNSSQLTFKQRFTHVLGTLFTLSYWQAAKRTTFYDKNNEETVSPW